MPIFLIFLGKNFKNIKKAKFKFQFFEVKKKMQEESIEKIYVKKTQLEHILCRPDTYVGSIQKQESQMWVYEEKEKQFSFNTISYVPGLYKIFDEILVNAADNYQRDRSMNYIKISINDHEISVENNGKVIKNKMFCFLVFFFFFFFSKREFL